MEQLLSKLSPLINTADDATPSPTLLSAVYTAIGDYEQHHVVPKLSGHRFATFVDLMALDEWASGLSAGGRLRHIVVMYLKSLLLEPYLSSEAVLQIARSICKLQLDTTHPHESSDDDDDEKEQEESEEVSKKKETAAIPYASLYFAPVRLMMHQHDPSHRLRNVELHTHLQSYPAGAHRFIDPNKFDEGPAVVASVPALPPIVGSAEHKGNANVSSQAPVPLEARLCTPFCRWLTQDIEQSEQQEDDVMELLRRAQAHYKKGEVDACLALLNSSIDDFPDVCVYRAFVIHQKQGDSQTEFLSILKRDEDNAVAWYGLSEALCRKDATSSLARVAHMFSSSTYPYIPMPRRVAPANTLSPGAQRDLDLAFGKHAMRWVQGHYGCDQSTFDVIAVARRQFLTLVQERLNRFSEVFVSGSAATLGTWAADGDIDFVITNPKEGIKDAALEDVEGVLRRLRNTMSRIGFFSFGNIQAILRARVPVVTYTPNVNDQTEKPKYALPLTPHEREQACTVRGDDRRRLKVCKDTVQAFKEFIVNKSIKKYTNTPIELHRCKFDVTVDGAFAVRNTVLQRSYVDQSPTLQRGILFLKSWGKATGIIDPKNGYISSYSMMLMWIYFLLQKGRATYLDPDAVPLWTHTELKRATLDQEPEIDELAQLGTWLREFFHFYAFEFDWDHHVVTLRSPQTVHKEALNWHGCGDPERTYNFVICIQDPYETYLNLAKGLDTVNAVQFIGEFVHAAQNGVQLEKKKH